MDLVQAFGLVEKCGSLGLLVLVLYKGPGLVMAIIAALDRNTRMIYHIATELGVKAEKGSDILREIPPLK